MHTEKERIFKNLKCISIDGTFKSVRRPFYQCVVIHGMLLSKSWFFFHVLMMTKTQIDYERVFRKIREISDITPMFVGVDFEGGLANAIEISFKAKLSYCFFHFGQSIWLKIQQIGLSANYFQNNAFKLDVRKIISLAFFPSANIPLAYEKI
ncbi:hypothetical protein DMUE_5761 [Dictyocoela muelleri]|nr:hypothetical protein DMUE_5761 [Dictyocoela muelleri]